MATRTEDEAGVTTGAAAQAKRDEETTADVTKGETTDTPDVVAETEVDEIEAEAVEEGPSGVGQGAGAVVSVVLGLASLNGGWLGTVAAARQTLIGQLETSSRAGVAQQIQAVYGDAWQATALWAGVFALAALVTGFVVLARPAFGAPGRPQAPWIKSVAWAGVAVGVIGLLLAVLKYTGILFGLPSAS
ncbi:hypothetical protein ABZ330_28700 [Streptomyces sp. NPDC006172]|uniref:hypothetical protein n=1 Tax=Streptomyces sp. NPDC006172 TaxID=3154470 RepID=UPI0033E63D03